MSNQGINYFYTGMGLPLDIWEAYYSFSGTNSGVLSSISGAKLATSGKCVNSNYYISNNGVGKFDGSQYVVMQNSTGDISVWTTVFDVQKSGNKEGVLFSSLSSSTGLQAQISGFSIGLTASNKVFFETYNEDGVFFISSNTELANRNVIAISKAGNGIYIDTLDSNSKEIISEKFEIGGISALNSNKWILGGCSGAPAWATITPFSGNMYSFNLFSDALRPDEIRYLLYGHISYVSGNQSYFDSNASNLLNYNNIAHFNLVDSLDTIETSLYTGQSPFLNSNKSAVYDTVLNEFFSNESSDISGVYPYINGLSQFGSNSYTTSGTIYNTSYILSGQFVPSGRMIFTDKNYIFGDICNYDVAPLLNTGAYNFYNFSHNGSINTDLNITDSSNFVFFNGVKLVSGYDYSVLNSNSIRFASGNDLYNGTTGLLHTAPYYTGYKNLINASGFPTISNYFAKNSSLIWRNGARQIINIDYLETSSVGTIANSRIYLDNNNLFNSNFNFITNL